MTDSRDHTQFSAFLCNLDEAELAALRGHLQPLVHQVQDQLLFVDLGPGDNDLQMSIDAMGKPFDPQPSALIV